MAASSASLSFVGGCTSDADAPKATMPMRAFDGCSSMNDFAATCAAESRFGSTSVAPIDSDTSIASMIVCCCEGSVTIAVGRAMATSIVASASNSNAGGT